MCPECLAIVQANIVEREGAVWLEKTCPTHGERSDLLEEDAELWRLRADYDRPGTQSLRQTKTAKGCPYDCGLCPAHNQHTCIGLLEITDACDLGCPVCYANAGGAYRMSLEKAKPILLAWRDAEGGNADVLQISGGEPTTHPDLERFIDLAREVSVRHTMLNTNGLRLARDKALAKRLGTYTKAFEVYLQFDGLDDSVYRGLRGRDLLSVKLEALQNLAEHDVPATLVCTVRNGLNDQRLGELIEFAMSCPNVRGVNFQPEAAFGRGPATRSGPTLTGILRRIERQTHGKLAATDFTPLPCDVHAVAIAVLLRKGRELEPIARRMDVSQCLPIIDDTLAFYAQDLAKNALKSACSGGGCDCMKLIHNLAPFTGWAARGLVSLDKRRFTNESFFRVSVHQFQDPFNYEEQALRQECVHVLTEDLRRIPFSAYNLVHRAQRRVDA